MLIICPNCKKRFDVDPGTGDEPKKLRCSSCKAVFRLVRKPAPARATNQRLKVVVANESAVFCQAVEKVLSAEPFDLFLCTDGKEALETVERVTPDVLLLDVALPTMFGFEVCERVKNNPALSGVKIVLIASIYDKTRYKRSPNSLYGADDYIEKHHIPDSLVPMIYRLAGSEPQVKSPTESELAAQEATRSEIRECEVNETSVAPAEAPAAPAAAALPVAPEAAPVVPVAPVVPAVPVVPVVPEVAPVAPAAPAAPAAQPAPAADLPVDQVKARRLARIIVSDIVLYNQAKVEQGIREGNFYDLLADDIREGERLYQQRVSQQVRDTTTFLKDAFEELIEKKRAELRG